MNKSVNLGRAIAAALDASAAESQPWIDGHDTFWSSLRSGEGLDTALYGALDASAEEELSWKKGEAIFWAALQGHSNVRPSMNNVVALGQRLLRDNQFAKSQKSA